jgi:hypothetical protein
MTVVPIMNGVLSGLSTDTKPASPVGYQFYENDKGDIHFSDGTYWWLTSLGALSNKRIGIGPNGAAVSAGTGMFSSLTQATGHANTFNGVDSTNGRYFQAITGSTSGTKGGYRFALANFTMRIWNPRTRVRFSTISPTISRAYIGIGTPNVEPTGDDPLNAQSGVLFGMITTNANYVIMHNDGTGATVIDDTGVPKDTTVREIKIVADNASSRFSWSLNAGPYTHITTEIPASTTSLTFVYQNETNEAVSKSLGLYNVFGQSDK